MWMASERSRCVIPSVELPAGTLILGTPYVATYNNSSGVWYLQSFFGNPYNVPIGGMIWFGTSAPNSSFVFLTGRLSAERPTQRCLALLAPHGAGDGTTTFNLPDLRGRVTAFLDNMGVNCRVAPDDNRKRNDAWRDWRRRNAYALTTEIPAHTHVNTLTDPGIGTTFASIYNNAPRSRVADATARNTTRIMSDRYSDRDDRNHHHQRQRWRRRRAQQLAAHDARQPSCGSSDDHAHQPKWLCSRQGI